MKTSINGKNEIMKHEGVVLTAYLCPAKVWTIGYGNTFYADGSKVKSGDKITKEQANTLLDLILVKFETALNKHNLNINQNKYDALISFMYNVGITAFNNSTLLKRIKSNDSIELINGEFRKWNKAGGKVLKGLVNRRESEIKLFNS